ncbi:MASE1 domain-containing protein [Dyella sp. 20L07]|uniref:MASE1 domain-containing protein n=1 Tax=Dyella sp. 20L07 TaxID=3384240 RepID=UPI003D28CDEB
MRDETGRRAWGRQWVIGAAYAIAYFLLQEVPTSMGSLPAGLRLACLLLAPYRYWPALILGECVPVAVNAWHNEGVLGWQGALVAALPPIAPLAVVVAWCRKRARLLHGHHQINMTLLLGTMLVGGLLAAVGDVISLEAMQAPLTDTVATSSAQILLGHLLGNYLGALALTPTIITLYLWLTDSERESETLWKSRLGRDCMLGVMLPLLVLMGLAFSSHGDNLQIFRIAMFLPVVWLTSRHGWQGAALGGTLASLVVTLTSAIAQEPAVIQTQALMAFAITTLLLLGARITQQAQSAQASRVDSLRGFQLAQQGLYLEELRLRQAADALEHIGHDIRDNQNRLLDRLRHGLSPTEERSYTRQALMAQREMHRLANALYPRGWRERGVPATLREGPFAQAIHASGATYACDLSGRGLSQLAPDVHMTLYRLACEVLVYLLSRAPAEHVQLVLRGGQTHGRRWVVMRIVGQRTILADDTAAAPTESWRQAMTLLGASGLSIASIRDRAQIYGGNLHLRHQPNGLSVTLLLYDSLRAAPPETDTAA